MPVQPESVRQATWLPRKGSERAAVLLLAALAAMAIVDLVHPNRPGLVVLIAVPIFAAMLLRPRAATTLSVLSTAQALVLPQSLSDGGVRWLRVAGVAGVSLLAVTAAIWRERLTATQLQLLAQRQDAERDRRNALELNDRILQDVFSARMWLDLGQEPAATDAITRALESTRGLVSDLLGEDRVPRPGELVREREDRWVVLGSS